MTLPKLNGGAQWLILAGLAVAAITTLQTQVFSLSEEIEKKADSAVVAAKLELLDFKINLLLQAEGLPIPPN